MKKWIPQRRFHPLQAAKPHMRALLLHAAQTIALTAKRCEDKAYRIALFAWISLILNCAAGVSKGVAGALFHSTWMQILSGYYLILCIGKFLVLRSSRKTALTSDAHGKQRMEFMTFRLCGVVLVLMTVVLQGVVIWIVRGGRSFVYEGYLVIGVALIDFVCLTSAVIYMVRNRKNHAPSIVAIKTISLATSLVSMLSLQAAMFASFGQNMDKEAQQQMNMATGTGVCLLMIFLGVLMIVQANRKIKETLDMR